MNNLNSVLIEGSLLKSATVSHVEGKEIVWLDMKCFRYEKVDDELREEELVVSVRVRVKPLAEICERRCEAGLGVRIVGRLFQLKDRIHIDAEHVEFK